MRGSSGRKTLIIAVVLVVAVVAIRAALPWWATRYVNDRFAAMGDYRGHVTDVDLALFRGAYTLHDLTIVKTTVKETADTAQPFLVLPRMDISVQWSALMEGELVGEIHMQAPVMNMVQEETAEQTQLGAGVNWPDRVRELFPFRFNRIEASNGTVTFRAPGIETDQSLTLRDLRVVVTNLTNARNLSESAFADFDIDGRFGANTPLELRGHVNPNARMPAFDVNMSLEGADLVEVNPWLREFLNVDAEKGTFSMYAELAAADGRFEGYIKPLLEDAEILRLDEPADGPLQKAWEGLVGIVSGILTNPEEDQVATRVPFSGDLDDPDAGMLAAATNLLRNAFVAAFTHSLEGSVSIEEVETDDR